MDSIEEIRAKLFEAIDPNNEYTQEDFLKEYGTTEPSYATNGSSGFDLRASEGFTIKSSEIKIVPTGLYFDIPDGFEIQVRPRSGLAAKYGITVLNSPGTIDADYTGEIKVILVNHGENTQSFEAGERIAQAVIANVVAFNIINLQRVNYINKETERGGGGFGSTGTK
jgi:dUTP pyrophosphatase